MQEYTIARKQTETKQYTVLKKVSADKWVMNVKAQLQPGIKRIELMIQIHTNKRQQNATNNFESKNNWHGALTLHIWIDSDLFFD